MRLIDNGKICAVNAKEQRRQEKWKKWKKQHVRKQREIRSKIEAENMTNAFYIESGMRIKKEKRR